MSNTEKLIKKLNENKELRKLKEQKQTKDNSSVVRVQQLKKTLVTLATDLFVNKKIKASLFKNMLSLTFTNITENELKEQGLITFEKLSIKDNHELLSNLEILGM